MCPIMTVSSKMAFLLSDGASDPRTKNPRTWGRSLQNPLLPCAGIDLEQFGFRRHAL
jgi:hypothetical protein